ncbi:MAG: carbohydrate binding family 9 domain-containing protein [Flavobacterium sp.]|nr:carbohydrate binding family 9 domain-containing protein [Flavobacterium sp.]
MPKKSYFFICAFLLFSCLVFSQKKTLQTRSTDTKITLDGKFDESVWKDADIATDFIMITPDNGKPVAHEKRTEVKVIYDHTAIYVAATLYDNQPGTILKELTLRDDFSTADHFGVFFNGYNDGQQEFRFFVSAAGVQQDGVYTEANGEDFSWDAIWDSHVEITNFGWTVEMKIPYAALRFPSEKTQTWGLNFYREIRADRQQYSWSFLNNTITNESTQAGIMEGIENIKTPTRLFLIPYASQYLYSSKSQKTFGEFKGGLDIKYGINDAFTLDAILIPDFGQTKFDNVELNLTAFEQQFTENRPFFTEGTDLFSKGDLLYSRRIGDLPQYKLGDNENFIEGTKINLINAFKISGRTKSGLGIGVLNAVTEKTNTQIVDNSTGTIRNEIEPLSNYNVLVLDQRFNKNSSVSLVNTNVSRNGEYRDANVSALVWDLNTKENTYNLSGDLKYSYINNSFDIEDKKGFNSSLSLGETKGKYRYNIIGKYVSEDFDNNDLGINFRTHYHSFTANSSYRILNPNKTFNTFQVFLNGYSEFDNRTGRIQAGNLNLYFNTTSKKNNYYSFGIYSNPLKVYDFYEPRSVDELQYVTIPQNARTYFLYSSNYNKKFAIDFNPSITVFNEKDRMNYGFLFSPRYRFDDHFSLVYSFSLNRQNNNVGWIDFDDNDNTIFARRNRITYINSLQGKYSINNKMNLNLNVRHYWSYVTNNEILTLQDDGSLETNTTYLENKNSNLNLWNMDLTYSWWFAPGSQVSVLYRNNAFLFSREFSHLYDSNINDALDSRNLNHVFSISIRYFIDYNTVKNSKLYKSFTKPKERVQF